MPVKHWLKGFCVTILCVFSTVPVSGDYTFGNREVESPEDGMPSIVTGLYLMSQNVPFDGHIQALNACAFLTEPDPNPEGTGEIRLVFYAAGYRLAGSTFKRVTDTLSFFFNINIGETFGCNLVNIQDEQQPKVLKGDRPGVLIQQQECIQRSISPPFYVCSAHVNIVDPIENCSQSLYFNNTRLVGRGLDMPAELNAIDGYPVDIFVNLDLIIEPTSPPNAKGLIDPNWVCATKFNETRIGRRAINVAAAVLGGFALVSGLTVIGVVLFYYCRCHKGKLKVKEEANDTDTESDADIRPPYKTHYRQANRDLTSTHILSSLGRTTSIPNDYSISYSSASSHRLQLVGTQETLTSGEDAEHNADDIIDTVDELEAEYEYADVEDYWEPANQETRLKEQIGSLNIKEIPFNNLEIKEELGSGQFATVHRGVWRNPEEGDHFKDVAVKCLEVGASEEQRISFLREAAIMGQFEHPNILQILAIAYSEDMQPILIVDLMHIGDLRKHLQSLRPKNSSQISHELSPTLLSYSRQIAFGMLYLSCKKFVHRDLAARNVLVAKDGTCKIADFGLSRDLHYQDYYVSQGGKVPVKWTAPEALHYRKYSTASDVWSYGCLLYEIWSLGCKPFSKSNNVEAVQQIASGYRLPPPPGCPKTIYNTMIKCWNPKPELRPPFMKIVVALQQPDFKILKWSLKDTRNLSENAMRLGAPLAEGECLFKSLQCTYTVKVDREDPPIDEAEPKILRNAAKGETSRNAIAKSNRVTVANYSSLDTQESPLLFASKFCSSL